MRVLFVHPSPLFYSEMYLRLEPIGLERVAQAARSAGHQVRLLDLQLFRHEDYIAELDAFQPEAVGFSLNYLPNVPEVIDLAVETRRRLPRCFIFIGGHSASFIPTELLQHAQGAINCVVRGEGEATTPRLLETARDGNLEALAGIVTLNGAGPASALSTSLDEHLPARDLTRRRKKYFIGFLDPCASIEFTRGCPWDCSFCSAWTFYGRSYRKASPEAVADDLAHIEEPGVFIVDDVAFIHPEDGEAIGRAIEKRRIKKRYYLETRCDVLLRNREVFAYWKRLGLTYMFLGLEAIDEEGLKAFRKRASLSGNLRALQVAREMGMLVAVNIIADPDWDERRFQVVREWVQSVPEIVNLTVMTPYPGTEIWHSDAHRLTSLDYRLFDIQHAVLPTRLPLKRFYEEFVKTQVVLNRKHLGWAGLRKHGALALGPLARGQFNAIQMLWKFNRMFDPERQYADHFRALKYAVDPPQPEAPRLSRADLYIHRPLPDHRSPITNHKS